MPRVCSSSDGEAAWVSSPDTSDDSAADSEVVAEAVAPPSVTSPDNLPRTLISARIGRVTGGESTRSYAPFEPSKKRQRSSSMGFSRLRNTTRNREADSVATHTKGQQ
jgi:hypothetical protein